MQVWNASSWRVNQDIPAKGDYPHRKLWKDSLPPSSLVRKNLLSPSSRSVKPWRCRQHILPKSRHFLKSQEGLIFIPPWNIQILFITLFAKVCSWSLRWGKCSRSAAWHQVSHRFHFNPLTHNDPYSGHTAPLTSKRCILYIYLTNTGTEYFKHGIYSPFFFSLFKLQFVS